MGKKLAKAPEVISSMKTKKKRRRSEKTDKQASSKPAQKKRKRWHDKKKYVYGNYPTYYHRRHDDKNAAPEPDPRLQLLKPHHLKRKRVLDLGCNTGLVTRELVETYGARFVSGVDIDEKLITQAKNSVPAELEKKLHFHCLNMLELGKPEESPFKKRFDVLLLLSTAKWVHLNHGDDGILRMFHQVNRLLKPGGLFVFEPQPWPSYKKGKILHERLTRHYRTLHIKPTNFLSMLKARFGFKLKKNLANRDKMKVRSGQNVGFKRPLYLLKKLEDLPKDFEDLGAGDIIKKFGGPSLDERESENPPNPDALKKSLDLQAKWRAAALEESSSSSEESDSDESDSETSDSGGDVRTAKV